MENITYLMGAGASYYSLPIYNDFRARFAIFQTFLEGGSMALTYEQKAVLTEIVDQCKILSAEFEFHNTPDTIAKKYFHMQDGLERLKLLKTLVTLFFIYEQTMSRDLIVQVGLHNRKDKQPKEQVDKRYDAFIASILENKYSKRNILPNVNILTWNYDVQFELCYRNYSQTGFIETQLELQSIPSINATGKKPQHKTDKFSIVHINGAAFSATSTGDQLNVPFGNFYLHREQLMNAIVDHYNAMKSGNSIGGESFLNFAWERDDSFPKSTDVRERIFRSAMAIAEKTSVLVIIGYSFPIFNRSVDAALFAAMKKLKAVYIQSPDAGTIKSILLESLKHYNPKLTDKNIKDVWGPEQFYLPVELNQEIPKPKYSVSGPSSRSHNSY